MIKIAFVDTLGLTYDGSTLSKRGLGGSESAVISMARELAKLDFDVYVFNDCSSDDSKPGNYEDVKYFPLKEIENFTSFDIYVASRSVVSFMPDNMKHQFKWSDKLPNLERVAMNSTYRVLWMHDTFCDGDLHIEELVTTGRIHKIFTLSDWHTTYVTNCHHGKRRHFETLKNHIFQTRNGINLYLHNVDVRNKDPNLFVYNASVTKGMIPLVEKIWPEFKKQNPSAKLTVIGGFYRFRSEHGPDEQELKHRELVEKCKDLDITFTGIIRQDEIAKILAHASFMMYPSAFPETFGISTLESLAYNTPLITCRSGALEETAIDIASYKLTYAIEPNVLFTEIDTDDQCKKFIELANYAYGTMYLHQQKMYACNQVKDICEWNTVALQWKQHFYKSLGQFLPIEEYRKVTDINHRVQKVFGRRYNENQSIRKQTEKRINVIVPVYNAEKYIDKCIQSVASQDYDNYHMYIINDASTDNTLNVIKNTINSLNENIKQRFSILNRTQNMGAVCNQISTIKSCCYSEEIVMLLDGDDWLVNDPNIFDMYNNLYQNGAEYTYGSCWSLVDNIPLIAQPYPAEVKKNKSYRNYKFNWNFPYPHLRTFLARLVLNLDESVFKDENGNWYGAGGDNATFYNIIEQANPDKVICVSDIVYNYNDTNPINDYKVNGEEQNKTAKTIVNKKESKMNELESMLHVAKNAPGSDINEHLQTLKDYADMCHSVVEMGVREGASTVAFLNADSKLTSYDLYISENVTGYFEIAKRHGKDCTYLQGDTRVIDIEECDMLFIDTEHTYEQLKIELNRHHDKVKSFIVFHDTVTFGTAIRNGNKGLWVALNEFLDEHKEWKIIEHFQNNNGLTIIAKVSELYTVIIPTMWRCKPIFESMLNKLVRHPLVHQIHIFDNDKSNRPNWECFESNKVFLSRLGQEEKNYYVNPCWNKGVELSETNRICIVNDDVSFDTKVFNKLFKHTTTNNGVFGLITGEEKFGHPTYVDGSIDIKEWKKGDIIHGFGQLMFVRKENWVPILNGLDIYFGDDFIFHTQLKQGLNNYLIHNIQWESPMATTSSDQSIVAGFYEREKEIYGKWAFENPLDYERKTPVNKVKKILIAIPTAKYIESETFKSIYDLQIPDGYEVNFQFFYGYNIDQVRNLIADWVVKGYDYLFSVDSDIAFHSNTLARLLNHDKDIVSGLYRQRKDDVILEVYDKNYQNVPANMINQNALIEVGAVGFGCVLVKKEVLEVVGYPQFVYKSGLTNEETISEDVYFCRVAREKGYKVYVDTGILCGHKGTNWFNLYPVQ